LIRRITFGTFLILIVGAWAAGGQPERGREVIFRYESSSSVHWVAVVGSFNHWSDSLDVLSKIPGSGKWILKKWLPFGEYQYRFKINGKQFVKDSTNDQYGGPHSNSLLLVMPPEYPGYRFVYPLPGNVIKGAPFELKIRVWPGQHRKISRKRSQLLLDGKPVRFKYHKKDSLFVARIAEIGDGVHHLWLRIEDNKHLKSRPDSLIFLVNIKNKAPVADAGNSAVYPVRHRIALDGGLSYDPDYQDLTDFRWNFLNSRWQAAARRLDAPFPEVIFSDSGKIVYSLQVKNDKNWSRPDTTVAWAYPFREDTAVFRLKTSDLPPSLSGVKSVAVAGEFNHWDKRRHQMHPTSAGRIWSLRIPLRPGEYEYKFLINDTLWLPDPANPRKIADGWGGFNSILSISKPTRGRLRGGWRLVRKFLLFQTDSLPANSRVDWIGDMKNPVPALRGKLSGMRLNFNKLAVGSYFFYRIFQKFDKVVEKKTYLLRNKGHGQLEVMDFNRAPEWSRDAVAYQIFPRRFGPDSSRSGTLQDINSRLDYLQQLGINCVWLMPVLDGPTEHGYGPSNFFKIEKDYGTLADFSRLIKALHNRKMRLIFDFVANHTSDQHPYFRSAWLNPASAFRNWYIWRGQRKYDYYNDWDDLPNLNYANPNVRNFMLKVARFWAEQGVDGFRADAAWGVPHSFWKDLRRAVKVINPDFVLLDEVLPRDVSFHNEEFDMSYDTDFYGNLLDVFNRRKPLSALIYGMEKTPRNYPEGIVDFRYIENQDLPRFIAQFGPGPLRIASALLLTAPGMPLIYYGQELGLRKKRPQMRWNLVRNPYFNWYRQLISLRKEYRALRRGKIVFLQNSAPDRVMSFMRISGHEKIYVFLNFSGQEIQVQLTPKVRAALCLFGYPHRIAGSLKMPLHLVPYGVQIWSNRGMIE